MNDLGLAKIWDAIGGALNIFDFSFFISGSVTFSIIMVDVLANWGVNSLCYFLSLPTWLLVISLLLAIYICGLVSWMIGRQIRAPHNIEPISNNGQTECQDDFCKEYDRVVEELGLDSDEIIKSIPDRNDAYSYMWIKLESLQEESAVKCHLDYCRRLWVMRALFEGLMFSWILAIMVMFDVIIVCKDSIQINLFIICILFVFFVVMTFLSSMVARSYARNQLKDTMIAYKVYVLNS